MYNDKQVNRIILNYKDKMYGSQSNAYYRVNLPSTYAESDKSLVHVETLFINTDLDNSTDIKNFNVHIKELAQPNSFSTATNTISDIVMSTNSSVNQNYPSHKAFPIPVQHDFFQNKMLNVYLSSPSISFGEKLEFPPVAMTGNTSTITNQAYGNGTYITTATSADTGQQPYYVFNKAYGVPSVYSFRTSFNTNNNYNTNTGIYQGINNTTMSGTTYNGEYITIQLPSNIILTSYDYTTNFEYDVRAGNTWVVGGSTNGTDWTLLDSRFNVSWNAQGETKTFTVLNNSTAFSYYRMLVSVVGNPSATNYRSDFGIAEWKLFGEPVYFTDYSLTLAITK